MSGLAQILMSKGIKVSGSDRTESNATRKLSSLGAEIFIGHSPDNIKDCDLIVYTAAIAKDNPELIEAKNIGKPCMERSYFLGILMKDYRNSIAVCGTHGKSTSTGMLSCIFLQGDEKPSVLLGGNLSYIDGNVLIGSSDLLIMEACEYVDSFLKFNPSIILMLNIELDHMDYFENINQIKSSFSDFAGKLPSERYCIVNIDDVNIRDIIKTFKCRVITYSVENIDADYYAGNIAFDTHGFGEFDMFFNGCFLCHVKLNVFGEHNISNAAGSFALAHSYGLSVDKICTGLENFKGIARRFEFKGEKDGVLYFDDYAHHPTELRATLDAARKISNGGRVLCVFQPHTYTRTKEFYREFADVLGLADNVVLAEVYAARETPIEGVSSEIINRLVPGSILISDFKDIAEYLTKNAHEGDIVICVGAGDICNVFDNVF